MVLIFGNSYHGMPISMRACHARFSSLVATNHLCTQSDYTRSVLDVLITESDHSCSDQCLGKDMGVGSPISPAIVQILGQMRYHIIRNVSSETRPLNHNWAQFFSHWSTW